MKFSARRPFLAPIAMALILCCSCSAGASETLKENEYMLTAGFYTAGIDIPSGSGTILLISGLGNIIYETDSGMQSSAFGKGKSSDGLTQKASFSIQDGTVISVSGNVKAKAQFSSTTKASSPRTYEADKAITLEGGDYEIGLEIPDGVYMIEAISGTGQISSINEAFYFDEPFGIDDGTGSFAPSIANAPLKAGTFFTISDGVKAKLTPEKGSTSEVQPAGSGDPVEGANKPADPAPKKPATTQPDKPYDGNEPEGTSEESGRGPDQFMPPPE